MISKHQMTCLECPMCGRTNIATITEF
jgi:4-hydroxy-3-methylbut-2-en-1-yl diphosphate synthase IspG/GcpE